MDEWLDGFNTFSIYQVLPQLIELWGLNVQTDVEAKKNFAQLFLTMLISFQPPSSLSFCLCIHCLWLRQIYGFIPVGISFRRCLIARLGFHIAACQRSCLDGQRLRLHLIYRLKFQRDIYKDLRILEKSIGEGDEENSNLDLFSLEMFERPDQPVQRRKRNHCGSRSTYH